MLTKVTRNFMPLLALALAMSLCPAEGRGLPVRAGVLNFGQIDAKLYRGAQPDAAGLQNLKRLGVKLIINLRMPDEVWKPEAAEAAAMGIVYTNIPLKGLGRPAAQQVQEILDLIEAFPGPVFVHCLHGCDRTGTIIACYRIRHDQWSPEAALREAQIYGLSVFERGMKHCILQFGQEKPKAQPGNNAPIASTGLPR